MSGELLREFDAVLGEQLLGEYGFGLTFSFDGEYLMHSKHGQEQNEIGIDIMETKTGAILYSLSENAEVGGFSPDNKSFYLSGENGIKIYNISNGAEKVFLKASGESCNNITFSDSGEYVSGFGDNAGYVWKLETGDMVSTLYAPPNVNGSEKPIDGLFIDNLGVIITKTENETLLMWDYLSGRVIARLYGSNELPVSIQGGQQLLVSSGSLGYSVDHAIRLMPAGIDLLVNEAKSMLDGRELTTTERAANYCEIVE